MKTPIVDWHIDTFSVLDNQRRSFFVESTEGQADLPRLRRGGIVSAFASLSSDSVNNKADKDFHNIDSQLNLIEKNVALNPEKLIIVKSAEDIRKIIVEGKFGIVIHLEGCQLFELGIDLLDEFYNRGLRSLSLTWNEKNAFATSGSVNQIDGLTLKGRSLVEKIKEYRILVDVAHLNKPCFWDLAGMGVKPLIGSHCACQKVTSVEYDLDDSQIKAIADSGGLVAVHLVKRKNRNLYEVVKNILHIIEIVGSDYAAIGSDFDGAELIEELDSAEKMVFMIEELIKAGLKNEEINKICWKNFERVISDII